MSGAEQVNGSFDHLKNDTHLLQKMSTEGWPTNCCCEHTHTHTCELQNSPTKKPSEGSERSFGRPTATVSTPTCVLQKEVRLAPQGQGPIPAVGIHMCFQIHTCAEQAMEAFITLKATCVAEEVN